MTSPRHEDIYARVKKHVIRSDDLGREAIQAERSINGSQIILCTLSMLSAPCMESLRVFDLIPVERLVIDEASQIGTFETMVCSCCLDRRSSY